MSKQISNEFKENLPDSTAYFQLFETTGWNESYGAEREELYAALTASWYTLAAYNERSELIGFGRIVSDGVLYAFFCDMIILPEYQRKGIGSRLLKKLIQRCEQAHIRVLWLFSASGKTGFYQKHGFCARPAHAPGMQYALEITND